MIIVIEKSILAQNFPNLPKHTNKQIKHTSNTQNIQLRFIFSHKNAKTFVPEFYVAINLHSVRGSNWNLIPIDWRY